MWIFTNTSNKNMQQFSGVSCDVLTPHRKTDGHKVAYITKPGNHGEWYFYTSTISSIKKTEYPEKGYATLEIVTHNSVYYFFKKM